MCFPQLAPQALYIFQEHFFVVPRMPGVSLTKNRRFWEVSGVIVLKNELEVNTAFSPEIFGVIKDVDVVVATEGRSSLNGASSPLKGQRTSMDSSEASSGV